MPPTRADIFRVNYDSWGIPFVPCGENFIRHLGAGGDVVEIVDLLE